MKHLDPATLNLYLDNALELTARAQADAHLAVCDACRQDLAALQSVFAAFAHWRAEPIPSDISINVLTEISSRPAFLSRWGAVLLAAQVLLGVALLGIALPTLLNVAAIFSIPMLTPFDPTALSSLIPHPSSLILPIPALSLWIWLAVVFALVVLWLITNRVLFSSLDHSRNNHRSEASQ